MSGDFDGLILRTVDYGEGNKIADIFTKERGKLTAIVRNAKEYKKSKGNISEPFCRLNINLFKGKEFYYLNQSSVIESYSGIREDIDKMMIAAYISEMTCSSIEDGEENTTLYELINKTFKVLSEGRADMIKLLFSYQLKFLSFIGFKPILKRYDAQGKPPYFFNYEDGGIISSTGSGRFNYKIEVEPSMVKLLTELLYSRLEELDSVEMNEYHKAKAEHIIYSYMVFHTGKHNYKSLKNLKTMKIL